MTVASTAAISAAFLASLVEVVEAFTIVLAVGTLRGWRPAGLGTVAALLTLAVLVLILGPLLDTIPIHVLQLSIGVLLLLFGMGWLRKAILRTAGVIPLHDEDAIFLNEQTQLRDEQRRRLSSLQWIAGITAYKAVLLEGLEVVFIVIAVSAGRGLIWPASIGALAACAVVLVIGIIIHKPLSRVPENTLKFAVGVMLSAFGVFWTGEGLGIDWPGRDLMLLVLAVVFLSFGLLTAMYLRKKFGQSRVIAKQSGVA
jgi:Ca2+/H+ antiporter, TMEM165/GDT1 family